MRTTPRELEILQMLADGEDLYWDGGREAWAGTQRTSVEMVYRLIRKMWIKQDGQSAEESYWLITERGRLAIAKPTRQIIRSGG